MMTPSRRPRALALALMVSPVAAAASEPDGSPSVAPVPAPAATCAGPLSRAVAALSDDDSYKVRLQGAVLLGRSGDGCAAQPLLDALERDPHPTVRAAAAASLATLGVARAAPALLTHAGTDPEPFVREQAARAVAGLDRAAVLDAVIGAYASPSPAVRREVIRYLGAAPTPAIEPTLALALGDVASVAAIARAGVAALPQPRRLRFLADAVEHRESAVRRGAVEVLAVEASAGAAQLAVRVFERDLEEPEVRTAARRALRALAAFLPMPALLEQAAPGPEKHARARALHLLGAVGGEGAERALVAALADGDPYVRGVAVMALGELGDPAALPAIEKLARDPDNERIMQLVDNTLRQLRSSEEERGR